MPKAAVRVPHLHTEYDPPFDPGIDCSVEPSLTQQNFRDECDINNIMSRYQSTGLLDDCFNSERGSFSDVASAVDYHTAQNLILSAQQVFDELPLKVRRRFNNDAGELLTFLDDPRNRDEAIELGLVNKAAPSPAAGSSDSPLAAGGAKPAAAAGSSPAAS